MYFFFLKNHKILPHLPTHWETISQFTRAVIVSISGEDLSFSTVDLFPRILRTFPFNKFKVISLLRCPLTGCRMLESCLGLFGAGGAIDGGFWANELCQGCWWIWAPGLSGAKSCTSLCRELYTDRWFTSSQKEPRAMPYASIQLCRFIQGCKNNRERFADLIPGIDTMPIERAETSCPGELPMG